MAQDSISYEDAFGLKKPDAQTPAAGAAKKGGSMSYEEAFNLPAAKPEGGFASDLAKSLKVGVQRLPGMATGLADLPFALAAGARPFTKATDAIGEATGFQPGKWADETKFSAGYEQGRQAIDDAWKDGSAGDIALSYLKNPGYTANQVAESLPSMVAGGAIGRAAAGLGSVANVAAKAGAVGPAAPGVLARAVGQKWAAPVAGGLGEGAVTAGQQMDQYKGEEQQKNALASLGAGLGTGLIGVGAGRVANALGLETAETAIVNAGRKDAVHAADEVPLSAKRRILGGMVSEALLQELPQSAQEQMWQNWADGKPLMDGVARAATEGAIAGGVMGAGANVSDGGAGKRRAQSEQLDRQNAQAAAARDQALAQEAMQPPTMDTIAGESINPVDVGEATFENLVTPAPTPEPDPYTAWDQQAARPAESAQQREDLGNGFEWNPGTSPGASAAVDGIDFQRDVDTSGLGLAPQPSPSRQLGLRSGPDAGGLEAAAALAVDTGASPLGQALARQQQEVQFLGATGRDVVPRRNGAALGDESNVIDVQAREVPDPRGLPMGQRQLGMGGQEAATGGPAQQGAPLSLPAPTNLREGLERIRQQRAEAARMAQQNQQGAQTNGTQAQEAQQTSAGQPQAGAAQARQQPAAFQPAVTGAGKASPAVEAARQAGAKAFADGVPREQVAAIPNVAHRAQQLRGYDEAARSIAAPTDNAPAAAPGSAASATAGVDGNGVAQAMRGLAQQFTQRHADSGLDTDRTFATVLNQFAHDVQQGKRTPESVQPMLARYQEMLGQGAPVAAAAAPGGKGQGATHKEAGQAAEPATPAVVAQSMQTAAHNEGVKPSNMRAWALGEVDKALLQAPSAEEHQAMAGNDPRRHVTFDVPGDGKFKVLNTPEHLQAFRKKVAQSPGFSSKGQKQAAPERNPGVQNGSSTKAAALNAMIEEGDFEAARDYAKAAGLSLDDAKPTGERKAQWAQYRKDGTVPAQPDTTPKEPSGYRLPDDVNKDWRDSAGRSSEHPDYVPTARQQLLMDAVGRAVDGGKFYAHDVNDAVANELGVTPEQRGRNRHNVDGGDFGYDAYMARNALDAQRGNAKSREIAKALSLQPGDKLGTLVFNDGKVTTGVAVTALSDTGLIATIAGKRGVATTHGQVGVDAIAAALDRAKERGKRKDGFAEFVAGRKQADANLNSAAVAEDTAMPGGQPQAATESGAQAEQPTDFIPAPDGGLDYGEITPEMGQAIRRQAGKIRLQQGNERFGLTHIESRHGEEIRNAGFASVQEFVADIAKNIDQVWKPDATSQLVALHVVKNDRVMFVQLQSESSGGQDFYTVNTAFLSRAGYVANKKNWKMLWEGRAQPSQSATSEQTPFAAPPQKAGEAATIPSGQSNASVAQISPQAQSSKPAESFTLSIRGFGDITMQVLNAVPTNPGETVVSERIIPANTRLSRADAEVLGLPADIKKVQAWRVSVIRSKDGKHGSLIEAMDSSHGSSSNAFAHFKAVENDSLVNLLAPSVANAARAAWEQAQSGEQRKSRLSAMEQDSQKSQQQAAPKLSRRTAADVTDSPAFRKWFGDSEVVDADGKPLIFYHGGASDFSQIKDGGRFQGAIFARAGKPSGYHEKQHAIFIKGPILERRKMADLLEGDEARAALAKRLGVEEDSDVLDDVVTALTDGSHYPDSQDVWDAIGAVDEADAQLEIQRLRGHMARWLGYQSVRTPDEFDGDTVMVLSPEQIKSATNNNGNFDGASPDIRLSRSASTQASYEGRIDALFGGGKATTGTRVLDRSDVMGLLGHPDVPLMLNERHLLDGLTNHPEMTAQAWKKVPGWLENPAAVYRDPRDSGRLVVIAPDSLAGYPVMMVIEPKPNPVGSKPAPTTPTESLLVTVYAKTNGNLPSPGFLAAGGNLLYMDTKNAPEIWRRGGVQFPKQAALSQGRTKILTEKNLAGWRRANNPQHSFAGQQASTADQHALAEAQSRLDAGADPEQVRQDTGWHQGADDKWRFEISDAEAKLKDRAQWATQRDALQAKSEEALRSKWAAEEARNAWLRQRGESPSRISSESKKDADFKALANALKKAETALDKARQAQEMAGRDGAGMTVGSLLDHPALFAAYPGIAAVRVELRDGLPANNASYSYDGRSIDLSAHSTDAQLLSTLLHEIQHGIQHIEGFASGGNPESMAAVDRTEDRKMLEDGAILKRMAPSFGSMKETVETFTRRFGREPAMGAESAALSGESADSMQARAKEMVSRTPYEQYRRLAGEVEARNTQARQGMTDAERNATPPSATADIADSDVIVTFNGKEMHNAPTPANAAPAQGSAQAAPGTPASAIRAAISKAYGKLLDKLEAKGLVALTQTQEEAIDAAAKARAAVTGESVEDVKRSLMESVKGSLSPMKSVEANIRRGRAALAKALDEKTSVHRAMYRSGLGWVDFVWGDDRKGLQHLMQRRQSADGMTADQAVRFMHDKMIAVIAQGAEVRRTEVSGSARLVLEGDGAQVVLVRQPGGNGWVLTGFELMPDATGRGATSSTATAAEATRSRNGAGAGDASIAQAEIDIKRSANGAIEGFHDPVSGKTFLIADALTAETAPGTLMHEVGVHMAADSSSGMQRLIERAGDLRQKWRNNPFVQQAESRMAQAGETSNEEFLAYVVTQYENNRAKMPVTLVGLARDFIAAVRAWLHGKGWLNAERLSVADIAAIARSNAKRLARDGAAVGTGNARMAKTGGQLDTSPEMNALRELAQQDEIFALPKSHSTNMLEIASKVEPEFQHVETVSGGYRTIYKFRTKEGQPFSISVRENKAGEMQPAGYYGFPDANDSPTFDVERGLSQRPGEDQNGASDGRGDVWIDVSQLKGAGDGGKVYAIAGDFAHNTGRVFVGDPAGLSEAGLKRRGEHMLSSALRWGTTRHLSPHPRQTQGSESAGVPPLAWQTGNDVQNLRNLVDVNLRIAENNNHDLDFNFDPRTGDFTDSNGLPIDRGGIEALATDTRGKGVSSAARSGGRTNARHALLRALLRAEGSEGGSHHGRSAGLLENLSRRVREDGSRPEGERQLKALFSRAATDPYAAYTQAQRASAERVFGAPKQLTLRERFDALRANAGTRIKQGLFDQFAPIAEISQKAYMLARMSKGTDGAVEAAMLYGRPFLKDGVLDVNVNDPHGGFAKVLAGLQGEADRFLQWVAASRSERLKAEGKENLLTDADISNLKSLNGGQMPDGKSRVLVYGQAMAQLNDFNEAVLKVALESGLIDQAAFDIMQGQPYVPFYRLMEEGDLQGPRFSAGLVGQQAFKRLKGGTQQLNSDLLHNMLLNWGSLYAAAARNRAALESMKAADGMGIAYRVPAGTKGAVQVRNAGVAEHWMVEDPYLMQAITAMQYTPGGVVKALAPFKRLLTFGVTVNPAFKVRNLIRDTLSAMALFRWVQDRAGLACGQLRQIALQQ